MNTLKSGSKWNWKRENSTKMNPFQIHNWLPAAADSSKEQPHLSTVIVAAICRSACARPYAFNAARVEISSQPVCRCVCVENGIHATILMEPVSCKNRKPGSVSMLKIRLFQNLLHPEQYIIETVRVHAEITKWNKIIKQNMNCSFTTTCKDVSSCFGEPLFSDLYVFVCLFCFTKKSKFLV